MTSLMVDEDIVCAIIATGLGSSISTYVTFQSVCSLHIPVPPCLPVSPSLSHGRPLHAMRRGDPTVSMPPGR
jgi:hypothetical protein